MTHRIIAMTASRLLAACVLLLPLTACGGRFDRIAFDRPGQSVFVDAEVRGVISTPSTIAGSDRRPVPVNIVCPEPSPDVAKAVGRALEAYVKIPEGPDAGLRFGRSEALLQLASRTVTIQYLRDGLFHACQAYANGAIDHTMYAVLLSGVDDTLVTTALAEVVGSLGTTVTMPAAARAPATLPAAGAQGGAPQPGASADAAVQSAAVTAAATGNVEVARMIRDMHAQFMSTSNFDSLVVGCLDAMARTPKPNATSVLANSCDAMFSGMKFRDLVGLGSRRAVAMSGYQALARWAEAATVVARSCAGKTNDAACDAAATAVRSGPGTPGDLDRILLQLNIPPGLP